MDSFEYNDMGATEQATDEIYSVPVKAGKRIYYFDVKSTRGGDYYLTITESRKRQLRDGKFVIDKHKVHLYKEDFAKFSAGFADAIEYIRRERPEFFDSEVTSDSISAQSILSIDSGYSSITSLDGGLAGGVTSMSDDEFFNSL